MLPSAFSLLESSSPFGFTIQNIINLLINESYDAVIASKLPSFIALARAKRMFGNEYLF